MSNESKNNRISIKLLVCYHKPAPILKDSILTPIHVGRAIALKKEKTDELEWLLENCIGDDTGDNISKKNLSYNEMTSLYWAWKNYDELGNPDYIGMMHYRRHFVLKENEMGEREIEEYDKRYYFDQIGYSEEKLKTFMDGLDYIVHIGKVNGVYKHYCDSHRKEDIDLIVKIINEKYPELDCIVDGYMNGNESNFCNMFIMKRELFFDYCKFVFPILEEFENRVDCSEKRLFVSERVSGIFFEYLKSNKELKYKIVPISYVDDISTVNIIIYKTEDSFYPLAVTLQSIIDSKEEKSRYNIWVVSDEEISCDAKYWLTSVVNNSKVHIRFKKRIPDKTFIENVSECYSQNKCLVLSDKIIVLNDLRKFFADVSVDDYYIICASSNGYIKNNKDIFCDLMVVNLSRLREKNCAIFKNGEHYIGRIPWYYVSVAGEECGEGIFAQERSRSQIIADASWKRFIFYNRTMPWEDPQQPLAIYWWKHSQNLRAPIPFPSCYGSTLVNRLNAQQFDLNRNKHECVKGDSSEEWRNYTMFGKLIFYYKNNGFKDTIRYCFNKYVRRR